MGLLLLCVCRLIASAKLRGLGLLIPAVLLLRRLLLLLLRHPGVCAADLSGELLPERARWLEPWAARHLLALLGHTVALLAVPGASPPSLLRRKLRLLVAAAAAVHLALVPRWGRCKG